MRVLEAKDFLGQQTAEQATLENVPLSDLEKRMMYFTETDECPEDPIALNDAFETEYATDEYEAKMRALLHHAYERLQMVRPEAIPKWDVESIQVRPRSFSNSPSLKIVTPNSFAFSYFDPGSVPTTT